MTELPWISLCTIGDSAMYGKRLRDWHNFVLLNSNQTTIRTMGNYVITVLCTFRHRYLAGRVLVT